MFSSFGHVEIQKNTFFRQSRPHKIQSQSVIANIVQDATGASTVHGDVKSRGDDVANMTAALVHGSIFKQQLLLIGE
jgi:hypothetical protein